jgi:hypothetical protein
MRALALSTILAASCGAACDGDHRCAVVGEPGALAVCDGASFRRCDGSNRGEVIACVRAPRQAVCTTADWTFENAQGSPSTK